MWAVTILKTDFFWGGGSYIFFALLYMILKMSHMQVKLPLCVLAKYIQKNYR